ncbi:MAG: (d)CMP kinase [Candidatus Nanohaloarchaea archaeon]
MGSYIEEFQEDREKKSDIVVTIDGPSGSGKGTLGEQIAEELGIKHFSASDVFYAIAEERGISHVELSKKAGKEVDLEVDRKTLERGLENDCVIDSRIASHVLGDYSDLKIFLTADLEERAERIAEREGKDREEVLEETRERDRENSRRYQEYYGIDTSEKKIYDLLIDNTDMDIKEQQKLVEQLVDETNLEEKL